MRARNCGSERIAAAVRQPPEGIAIDLLSDEFNGMDESHRLSFLERASGVRASTAGHLILEVRAGHLRTLGIAHGGVIATLLDSVMGMDAQRSSPPDHYVVTAQLNVHFIRPAFEGETLVASSEVRHSGRKTAVAQGEIRTSSGAPSSPRPRPHLRLRPAHRPDPGQPRPAPRIRPEPGASTL